LTGRNARSLRAAPSQVWHCCLVALHLLENLFFACLQRLTGSQLLPLFLLCLFPCFTEYICCHAEHSAASKRSNTCHAKRKSDSQQAGPDVGALDPILQQQWDHAANAHLGNIVIKRYSHKFVWWVCHKCPDGHLHQWESYVYDRTGGAGCPQCAGKKVCKHNSLATKRPEVIRQWNFSKNDRTPEAVVAFSNASAEWICDVCHHEWATAISNRTYGNHGCPKCNCGGVPQADGTRHHKKHPTFEECQHPLLKEWDYERNEAQGIFPSNVTLRSRKMVSWVCDKCPKGVAHRWCQTPSGRLDKNGDKRLGCPVCSGWAVCECNSLQTQCPKIASEWDYNKNKGTPNDHTAGSNCEAWWISADNGSWKQTIVARTYRQKQNTARAKAASQSRKQ